MSVFVTFQPDRWAFDPYIAHPTTLCITIKTAFTICVVKDHLVFMTKIPCMDDLSRKVYVVSEYLSNMTRDRQILHALSHSPGVWEHSRVHMYLVIGLCKLGTTFCVNFESQRCNISVYTAVSALWLFGKWLPLWIWEENCWFCMSVLATLVSQITCCLTLGLLHQVVVLKSIFYSTKIYTVYTNLI